MESSSAALTCAAGALTLFWPDWIEKIFGVDPDHGSGAAEWLVTAVLLIVSITLGIMARIEWRRIRLAQR